MLQSKSRAAAGRDPQHDVQLPTAPRIAPALALLTLLALSLTACGAEQPSPTTPRLLASAYEPTRSRLVLIDPANLNAAPSELAVIDHAEGWDVEGVVAPSGDAAAVLAVPPGYSRPREDAVLWLIAPDGKRLLAENLDLYAGLAFAADGGRIAVARNHQSGSRLDVLDTRDGALVAAYQPDQPLALFPLEIRSHQLWAAALEPDGWALWRLAINAQGEIGREQRWPLGRDAMRRWTISPDADAVAMEVRNGADFWVAVHQLTERDAAPEVSETQDWQRRSLRSLRSDFAGQPNQPIRRIPAAAAPAWRSNGELTVGRWGGDGFTLPIAWDRDGRWLAVAAYDGDGPADPGRAWTGLVRSDRGLERIEQADIYALGWWRG